jgi:hypothetical protein
MKTHIYAVYLPGSERPDYVGSHAAEPPERSTAMQWRYKHCRYVGQGAWVDSDGLMTIPRNNKFTPWGVRLLELTPFERQTLRVDILATVDESDRWNAEAQALRDWQPPYNKLGLGAPSEQLQRRNAYMRMYLAQYLKRNPEKAAAKREADKARASAKRAAQRAAKEAIA